MISLDSPTTDRSTELKPILDKAIDWIQVKNNTWLLYTSSDPKKWYARIKPKLRDGERVFISEVDPNMRSGWMPNSFWKFIKEKA